MVAEAASIDPDKYGAASSSYDSSTGTFKFALCYYCEAGIFGAGSETFKLTAQATRAMAMAKAKVMAKKVGNRTVSPAPRAKATKNVKALKPIK